MQMRMFDLQNTLPNYYLHKTDVASMANSLEIRTPFVDRLFINDVLPLSAKKHFHFGKGKALLREILKGTMPKEILKRKKQGFSRPVHLLLTPQNLILIQNTLRKTHLFNNENVRNLISSHTTSQKNGSLLWRLLVFSWWFNKYGNYLTLCEKVDS